MPLEVVALVFLMVGMGLEFFGGEGKLRDLID